MIEIITGPFLIESSSFLLSWHGVFSFIAVAAAVFLVGRWAPLRNINPDDVYSIAIWAIISGIIGARLVHVIDHLQTGPNYLENPSQIFAIWSGGIGVWGGILGGAIGGIVYGAIKKMPVLQIADLTAPAMLIVQSIGRLGDIVNGEHCAKATDYFFGFIWTNAQSAAVYCSNNGLNTSVHPVIAFEIFWNLTALMLLWNLKDRIKPAGMLFCLYLALYSTGRFLVTFLREDRIWGLGLQEAQFISIAVVVIMVPLLVFKARFGEPDQIRSEMIEAVPQPSRAERRRAQASD